MFKITIQYIIIGLAITWVGIWLMIAPRESKIGVFLGPMICFRFLGFLFLLFGIFTFAVGFGLRQIGPVPIIIH